jgi:hypothetical protein
VAAMGERSFSTSEWRGQPWTGDGRCVVTSLRPHQETKVVSVREMNRAVYRESFHLNDTELILLAPFLQPIQMQSAEGAGLNQRPRKAARGGKSCKERG